MIATWGMVRSLVIIRRRPDTLLLISIKRSPLPSFLDPLTPDTQDMFVGFGLLSIE
jgi:hypothetical protein